MSYTIHRKGYSKYINVLIILGELFLLNVTLFCLVTYFRDYLHDDIHGQMRLIFLTANAAYFPTLLLALHKFQDVRIHLSNYLVTNAIKVVISHLALFLTLLFLLKVEGLSRYFVLSFSTTFLGILISWWFFVFFLLKKYRQVGFNFKNVVFVGNTQSAFSIYNELIAEQTFGYRVSGFFSDDSASLVKRGITRLGSESDIISYLENNKVDELFCAIHGSNDVLVAQLMSYCENHLIRFFFIPSIPSVLTSQMKLELVGMQPVLTTRREPMNELIARFTKRFFDLVMAVGMLILSPFWFFPIALLVKLSSPGPVLFKQLRTGRNGKDFWCYKFRSMKVNVDSDSVQATRNDPRKTRVGDFLRRTNLDELPQFFNILKGDMSVVGPRPHMLKHTQDYSRAIDKYMVRHYVKPGLTGWAQVNGYRGETKEEWQMKKRIEYDIWYLENWSFGLDIKIIAQTGLKMLKQDENAF